MCRHFQTPDGEYQDLSLRHHSSTARRSSPTVLSDAPNFHAESNPPQPAKCYAVANASLAARNPRRITGNAAAALVGMQTLPTFEGSLHHHTDHPGLRPQHLDGGQTHGTTRVTSVSSRLDCRHWWVHACTMHSRRPHSSCTPDNFRLLVCNLQSDTNLACTSAVILSRCPSPARYCAMSYFRCAPGRLRHAPTSLLAYTTSAGVFPATFCTSV